MRGVKQMQFGEAVARALLIGVEIGGLDGMWVGSGSKMGKLQKETPSYAEPQNLVQYAAPQAERLGDSGDRPRTSQR